MNDLCSMLVMDSTKLIKANVGSLNAVGFSWMHLNTLL